VPSFSSFMGGQINQAQLGNNALALYCASYKYQPHVHMTSEEHLTTVVGLGRASAALPSCFPLLSLYILSWFQSHTVVCLVQVELHATQKYTVSYTSTGIAVRTVYRCSRPFSYIIVSPSQARVRLCTYKSYMLRDINPEFKNL
jgi:hypothetical protein